MPPGKRRFSPQAFRPARMRPGGGQHLLCLLQKEFVVLHGAWRLIVLSWRTGYPCPFNTLSSGGALGGGRRDAWGGWHSPQHLEGYGGRHEIECLGAFPLVVLRLALVAGFSGFFLSPWPMPRRFPRLPTMPMPGGSPVVLW